MVLLSLSPAISSLSLLVWRSLASVVVTVLLSGGRLQGIGQDRRDGRGIAKDEETRKADATNALSCCFLFVRPA
jgi:hypothetical protein